jgi:hypothetical protein
MADHSLAANIVVGIVILTPFAVVAAVKIKRHIRAKIEAEEAANRERLKKEREYWEKASAKRVVGRRLK